MNLLLKKLLAHEDLSKEEMQTAMRQIMSGTVSEAQIAGFLIAIEMKTPTITEIATAASVMREFATKIKINQSPLIDIVGTGGDHSSTFNISTTAAFVIAAAGAIVAKHGNRSVSSSSGSADVLERAGVNIALTPEQVRQCIEDVGIGFLFAPTYHTAMQHVAKTRKALGVRTYFNLLGPLTNPASANHLVVGVFDKKWLLPTAEVLRLLQCQRALVVHSEDGLDEISSATRTHIVELNNDHISSYTLNPTEFGLALQPLNTLHVKDPSESLDIMRSVLRNDDSPARNIILLNAGAAIYVAGLTQTIADGIAKADSMLKQGFAHKKFEQFLEYTNKFQDRT